MISTPNNGDWRRYVAYAQAPDGERLIEMMVRAEGAGYIFEVYEWALEPIQRRSVHHVGRPLRSTPYGSKEEAIREFEDYRKTFGF